jgi:hypothetical protein
VDSGSTMVAPPFLVFQALVAFHAARGLYSVSHSSQLIFTPFTPPDRLTRLK